MNKLNREDFILQLRDKLPQYKDLDDDSLVDIVIKQYPVYESQVDLKKKRPYIGFYLWGRFFGTYRRW